MACWRCSDCATCSIYVLDVLNLEGFGSSIFDRLILRPQIGENMPYAYSTFYHASVVLAKKLWLAGDVVTASHVVYMYWTY